MWFWLAISFGMWAGVMTVGVSCLRVSKKETPVPLIDVEKQRKKNRKGWTLPEILAESTTKEVVIGAGIVEFLAMAHAQGYSAMCIPGLMKNGREMDDPPPGAPEIH